MENRAKMKNAPNSGMFRDNISSSPPRISEPVLLHISGI